MVREVAEAERTAVVIAHSVASVIASLAARHPDSGIHTIISLEGNLTAADAYFSGMAADYENPIAFHDAFLVRLDEMAQSDLQPRQLCGREHRVAQREWDVGYRAGASHWATVDASGLVVDATLQALLRSG